jgi:hypothetical protein
MHTHQLLRESGPMGASDSVDRLELGGLWRDVVNFLRDGVVTPDLLTPLLDTVAPRWADWTYFMGRLSETLVDSEDRTRIEYEVACTKIGYRLWVEQRKQLAAWAARGDSGALTGEQLASWWLGERRDLLTGDEHERLPQFLKMITFTAEELPIINRLADRKHRDLVIYRLHQHLYWLEELEALRDLSTKTWPADPRQRRSWTPDELGWVNRYYAEQQPEVSAETRNGVIDPMELESVSIEGGLGFGLDGLDYCMLVLMRAAVIDFTDELLEATRFPKLRGSLRCIDCGQFAGRRALGYGQLYCSDRCKKRAAKRRYRIRARQHDSRKRVGRKDGQPHHVDAALRQSRASERLQA